MKGADRVIDFNKIDELRGMIDTKEDDSTLLAYLHIAESAVLERKYPYDPSATCVPPRYEGRVLEIAAYLLNKRGAEGQTSHSENGVSRSYESASIPESMLSDITPCVGVI